MVRRRQQLFAVIDKRWQFRKKKTQKGFLHRDGNKNTFALPNICFSRLFRFSPGKILVVAKQDLPILKEEVRYKRHLSFCKHRSALARPVSPPRSNKQSFRYPFIELPYVISSVKRFPQLFLFP